MNNYHHASQDDAVFLRWSFYLLIIVSSSLAATYRLYRVNNLDESIRLERNITGSPMLCANDRSRWCTIRALGENGKYEIDDILADPATGEFSFDRRKYDRNWVTIDLVKHRDRKGEMHYYSSKPPLLPTLLAYLYRVNRALTGKTLADDPFPVVHTMLLVVNIIPMAIFLLVMAGIFEQLTDDLFTRIILMIAAAFGTFLTPFLVTLNNHLPAAISVGVAMFALLRIHCRDHAWSGHWFVAGLFSAFAAANELPALSFVCFAGLLLTIRSPIKTLALFVPGVFLVAAAFFLTNYNAHGDWIPPYAHRKDGPVVAVLPAEVFADIEQGKINDKLLKILDRHQDQIGFYVSSDRATLHEGQMPLPKNVAKRYVLTQGDDSRRLAIVQRKDGVAEVRLWGNWYEYPESRWLLPNKSGIDQGEPDPYRYALHCLIGHHGIFSLTPMWLLAVCGIPMFFTSRYRELRGIGLMILIVSVVVVGFYLARPVEDRNYGGGTSCLRWLLWLAPMWLMAAVPFVEWIGRNIWGKIAVSLLVAGSIASAHYSANNPWVHPWLYELLVRMEWIKPFDR